MQTDATHGSFRNGRDKETKTHYPMFTEPLKKGFFLIAPKGIQPRLGRRALTSTIGENVFAFVPPSLPPDPAVHMTRLYGLLERANRALGRLDGISAILPDTHLFLYMYVRKEALLLSQIEGTRSSLSDLLLFESDFLLGVPIDDVGEVSNYVDAMTHGLARLRGG